ncbi:hypothetical protein OIDMADRAFT_17138 [Oidiodendron maius Zn]|uniref:Uncharacterized protein n=1 Tax=Oidiodendron maius (strain Zn) TaxID=913774 RepID=A0A0C3HCN3_OIDMZ|nr:hypothetical protein OIDMADRAFT_17138 [Oidiodendron maius Zn]
MRPLSTPPAPFHTITIDFILSLPKSNLGNDAMMSVTDKLRKSDLSRAELQIQPQAEDTNSPTDSWILTGLTQNYKPVHTPVTHIAMMKRGWDSWWNLEYTGQQQQSVVAQ